MTAKGFHLVSLFKENLKKIGKKICFMDPIGGGILCVLHVINSYVVFGYYSFPNLRKLMFYRSS